MVKQSSVSHPFVNRWLMQLYKCSRDVMILVFCVLCFKLNTGTNSELHWSQWQKLPLTRISQWETMDEESCEPAQCDVYTLQRHTAHSLLHPGLTTDLCINSFHNMSGANEQPGRGIDEEVYGNSSAVSEFFWFILFLGELFFDHMQGSKTSVFIKDILFFRLEEITRKGITNKSLQREKKPATCSLGQPSWTDPEHWQPGNSPARPQIPAQIPHSCTVHAPLTSHPTCPWAYFTPALFYLQINLESTLLTLQALAYCVILMPSSSLFHKEKVHPAGILAGLLSVPHVPPLGKRPLHRHPAMAFLPTYLLPSFSPTSNLALSVLTQYKPAPIVSHILAFPPQYVTDRKAIPQLDYKGCAGNHKSA